MINSNPISTGLALSSASAAIISLRIYRARGGYEALPGCGGNHSGCDAVLHSRWSRWGAWSVAALSATAYMALTLAACLTITIMPLSVRTIAWRFLVAMTPAIVGAAAWFIGLQAFLLRRFCAYCSLIHAIGIGVACLIWISGGHAGPIVNDEVFHNTLRTFLPGLAGLLILICVQLIWSPRMYKVTPSTELPTPKPGEVSRPTSESPQSFSTGMPSPAIQDPAASNVQVRGISVYGGKVKLNVGPWPLLGSRDAEDVFVYFFDYTCDTCRHLHALLVSIVKRDTKRWAVLLVPIPAESFCNPHVTCRFAVHAHACAYARLGLAVWKANPDQYEAFDKFLFEGERPPPVFAAHAEANRLIGTKLYDPEITDVDFDPLIQSGIKMFHSLGLEKTPVLLLRNGKLQGHVNSLQDLVEIFWKDSKIEQSFRNSLHIG